MTGAELKSKFLDVYGCFPVIHVDEYWDGKDLTHRPDTIGIFIDTEKLDVIEDYYLSYVESLFEEVLKAFKVNQTKISTSTSHKYSFGGTPEWWHCIEIGRDEVEQRKMVTLEIGVYY